MSSQLVVLLENRPGALADLTALLADAEVNIDAILVEGAVDFGYVRLHASPVRKAEKALKDGGYQYKIGQTLDLELHNEPGALAEAMKKLAKAKVNVEMLFGTASDTETPKFILMVDDLPKARKALGLEK